MKKKFYHGTTNLKADEIKSKGLIKSSYLTTSFDDACYYARTGGEWDLQDREETWEKENGIPPRKHYDPDLNDMFKDLYPQGQYPVVIVFLGDIDGSADAGAEGAIVTDDHLSSDLIDEVIVIKWEE